MTFFGAANILTNDLYSMIYYTIYTLLNEVNKSLVRTMIGASAARVFHIDHELLIDPPPPRGNFVHYDFLKLRYIRSKMTHVGHLAVGALPCNSHVNCVTLKHLQILLFKYKAMHIFYLSTC